MPKTKADDVPKETKYGSSTSNNYLTKLKRTLLDLVHK